MRYYMRQNLRTCLAMFHAKTKEKTEYFMRLYDAVEEQNMEILNLAFSTVHNGGTAYSVSPFHLAILHPSTRGDFLQESFFVRLEKGGEWLASSHRDIHSAKDLECASGSKFWTINPTI